MNEEIEFDIFMQWATTIGISDSPISSANLGYSLSVSNFPQAGGRGLAAARDLNKGELILRVPKAALMTSNSLIGRDEKLPVALRKYPSVSSTQILCVALLHEVSKGKSSWWYPYLTQMPRSYNLLESFSQFEIEALQIDDAIWNAEKAVQKSKIEREEANQLMAELKMKPRFMSFKAWLWASATISSRTMHIPWDTAGCLCPVGDFFNYTPPGEEPYNSEILRNCGNDETEERLIDAGYNEVIASYCFYAKRNYKKGEQVLLSYGCYTNLELLEHYGFLLDENPNDKAFIPLEPEMYNLCSWPKESLYISRDGVPSFALISTVRLWATPVKKRRSIGHILYSGNQISDENEVAVSKWIAKKCHTLLGNCSTSIADDTLLLRIIEKFEDCGMLLECEEASPALIGEIGSFLESVNGMNGKFCGKLDSSSKASKLIYRWKLAVEWRHKYKNILSECISHCNKMMDNTY